MKQNLNFTVHIEWDGGGDEEIVNPEWRKKSDAPDKQGRVSHRDARVSSMLIIGFSFLMYCSCVTNNPVVIFFDMLFTP
jgi:hypothetical protein